MIKTYSLLIFKVLIGTVLFSTHATSTQDTSLLQCWKPEQLVYKHSEKRPRFGIRKAFIAPPKGVYQKQKPLPAHLRGAIRSVKLNTDRKLIALTLDLCELPREVSGYDGRIIDYLRKHKIKATFFTGGKWFLTHSERAQQLLADPLFEIGSHAWTHANFRASSSIKMKHEIQYAQLAYEKTRETLSKRMCLTDKQDLIHSVPQKMNLFRFPYGACTSQALKKVADNGLLTIQWNLATGDPSKGQSARRIARQVLRNVKPGAIIIAHANGRGWNTAKALPLFIPQLIAQGYEFVTVTELLNAGTPVISKLCYNERIGDTNHFHKRKKRKKKTKLKKASISHGWRPYSSD